VAEVVFNLVAPEFAFARKPGSKAIRHLDDGIRSALDEDFEGDLVADRG
jgi:hypothetical protein